MQSLEPRVVCKPRSSDGAKLRKIHRQRRRRAGCQIARREILEQATAD